MTIHYAPARPAGFRVLRPLGFSGVARAAANDNADLIPRADQLDAALRHFAAHGLGAAGDAARMAQAAWSDGDATRGAHWLAICRTLDPRLARALVERKGRPEG